MSTLTERVDALLEQRNMKRNQLAEAVGLSKDKMSKSMSGSRQFTVSEIAAIGERLDVDLFWLIHGRVDPLGTKVAFRHVYDHADGHHEPPAEDERVDLELVQRAYSLAEAAPDDRFDAFKTEVGAVDDPGWPEIRTTAAATRRRWLAWLDNRVGPLDVEGFLESIGVDLIVMPAPMGRRAHTYSLELRGRKIIVAGSTRAWYSAVFGVFHELGHLLFGHMQWRTDEQRTWHVPEEPAANGFAADTLLPAKEVWNLKGDEGVETLAALCWNHQIGADTLTNRCNHLRQESIAVTQKQVADVWHSTQEASAAARSEEWHAPRFPAWLVTRHKELVADGVIPADTLAAMTDTPVEDLVPSSPSPVTDDVAKAMEELGL